MAQVERKLPSDRTIAFAAAVISSKPADLTVREYISLLNRHVAKGRRENALSAAYRHLDRSAYWRAECERAKADYRAAEEARIEALREADVLKTKLEAAKTAGSAGAKRKRANGDYIPYSREIKKGRKDAEEKREVFLGGLVIEEVEVGDDDVGGQSLMRTLYQIGMFFKPGLQVNTKDLAYRLCATATETAQVVVDALDQQHPARLDGSSDLATIMTAAGRMVAGILAGLQKLVRMDTSQALRGQVTYALVRMYERLMAGFDQVSKREALEETAGPSIDQKSAPEKAKPKSKGGTPRVNIKDVPVLNALAGLLSGILKQLESKQEPHKEIFEGFLFCILSKLGERIYTINFSHPRAASVTEELEAPVSSGQSDAEPTPIAVSLAIRQAQLEAPYLINLLKQSLALSPSFLNPPASTASKNAKPKATPKPGSVTKATLTLAVKERLQSTLVNSIFGPEGIDEDSDLFLNCLQMPAAAGSAMTVPRVKEVEVGTWFQGEVWRMLGWEVLGRDLDNRVRG